MSHNAETAILAGGCFWGVQELLRRRDGVISTRVGYTGGENDHPTYRNHPGHAEAVEIVFDPERISYRDILEFFFQIHDPTTKDRQGNDIGSSYRSEIFYTSDEQRQVAEDTIADVDASGLWPGKVVTEISEAVPFWEAEPEHQDYLQRYPERLHLPLPAAGLEAAAPRDRRLGGTDSRDVPTSARDPRSCLGAALAPVKRWLHMDPPGRADLAVIGLREQSDRSRRRGLQEVASPASRNPRRIAQLDRAGVIEKGR